MDGKLNLQNYLGYGLCDLAGMLAFSALGSYLSVFCTDILKISTTAVFGILLAARIWDGINDPIMGAIAQNRKPGKYGKYRPFLLAGIPMALVSVLCLTAPEGLSAGQKVFYAAVCYIAYGMLYTVVLVPYGSMASVMTRDEQERSRLSMFRSIGGGIGSLPATLIFPLTVFTGGILDGKKLSITMLVLALFMILFYIISFLSVRENYTAGAVTEGKISLWTALGMLLKNRAFVIMSLAGCLHMAVNMFLNSVNVYLFKDYFKTPGLLTVLTVVSYLPMLLMVPFAGRIISRFGKRSVCIAGFGLSAAAALLAFLCRFETPLPYILCSFLINTGMGFMTLEVWAMAADVIDAVFVETGRSMEAVSYSCFTFMRKLGQALAATVPLFLGAFGYDSGLVEAGQSAKTLAGIYTTATFVPFLLFLLLFVLMLLYPMDQQRMRRMHEKLAEVKQ